MKKTLRFLFVLFSVTCCISQVQAQISLTATGGTTTGTYTTLAGAFTAINSGTHTGAIVISITANSSESGPCVLNSTGAGSASYTSILIQPTADGLTISGATATGRGLIELNGADNVTINGDNPNTLGINRNLTITNTAANTVTFTSAIRLVTGTGSTSADGNTIKNCIINGSATGSNISGTTSGVVQNTFGIYGGGGSAGATTAPSALTAVNTAGTSSTMNALLIDNNAINNCARAVSVNGAALTSIDVITVSNNTIGATATLTGIVPFTTPTSTVYTVGITIQGATTCNITGNTIQNIMSYNSGAPIRGIEVQGTSATTTTITNNTISGIAENNTSAIQSTEGIFIGGMPAAGSCLIDGNTLVAIEDIGSGNSTGININNTNSPTVTVSNNKLSKIYAATTNAWAAYGINLNGGNNILAKNNFISDVNIYPGNGVTSTTYQAAGIKMTSGTGHQVLHNTIQFSGGPLSGGTGVNGTACIFITSSAVTGTIRNNIVSNQFSGWATGCVHACIFFQTGGSGLTINNNAYFAGSGNYVCQLSTGTTYTVANFSASAITPATNFRAYSSTLGSVSNDNASVAFSTAPPFASATDLHIPNGTTTAMESGGATGLGVTTDIDGQVRPGPAGSVNGGAIAPDMGADEFDGIPIDVIAPGISYTALANTCTAGDRTITATITDNLGVVITGALVPRIYYKRNTGGSWISKPGTLSSGTSASGTWSFTITAADMAGLGGGDQVYYYIVAQDNANNVATTAPAGFAATNVNTITSQPTTTDFYYIQPSSGTFNVGVGQTYATITSAVNAYNTNTCLTGAVVYNLTDNTYPSETFPITILNNTLASSAINLTIKVGTGVNAVITSTSSAAAVFKLLNARYITIDGVNSGNSLSVVSGNTGTNVANIWLASSSAAGSGCNNITLKNMNITGANTSSASVWGIIAGLDGTTPGGNNGMDNDNITITGNTFLKNGYAVWTAGTAATSSGANDNWVVSNNIVGPSTAVAANTIGVNGLFFRNMVNLTVSNNTIQNIISTFGTAGIYMEQSVNGAQVTNNTLNNITSNNSGSSYGILAGTTVINANIARNTITSFYSTYASGAPMKAIVISAGAAAANDTVANNMISDVYNYTTSSTTNWPIGISVEGATGKVLVAYNTVSLFGPHTGANAATGSACFFTTSSSTALDVRNNIFSNSYDNTGSATDEGYAIYCSTSSFPGSSTIDYNDYYVTAPAVLGNIGSGTTAFSTANDKTTLAAIQTAFGGNTHSINVQPTFYTTTNLHLATVAGNTPLTAGTPISQITTDRDGTTRSATTPVIGAHEANLSAIPPAITYTALGASCTTGDRTLTATIADAGSGVPVTGSLVPRIYYRKGTSGTWYSQPGTLTSGTSASGTWSFTIVAADMGGVSAANTIYYYVIAQNNSGYTGSIPFGAVASNVNTVTTPPTVPNSYAIVPSTGTINVGVGQPYTTISDAVNAYNNNTCLSGPITYVLTDATYPNEPSYPITILNNVLASATATLTIRPGTGINTTITSSTSASSVFKLLNARYVTIDGVNSGNSLTLVNANTGTNTSDIWLASTSGTGPGCNNIALKNMTMSCSNNTSASVWSIIAGQDGTTPGGNNGVDNDNITITGNTFFQTGYAIWAGGNAAFSSGGNDNWVVANNIVGPASPTTATYIGVNGMFFRNMINLQITNNTLRNIGIPTSTAFGTAGFYLETNITGARISGNTLTNLSTSASASNTFGLYIGTNVVNSSVYKNVFTTLYNPSTSGGYMRGIDVNTGVAASNDTIYNNMISDIYVSGSTTPTNSALGICIENSATGGVNVWYNSVNFFGAHTGSTSATITAALYVSATGGNIDIRNNILSNTYDNSSSSTDKNYPIYVTNTSAAYSNIDFNDYYTGSTLLGYMSSDQTTLSAMQTSFGGNTHSVSVNPSFTSTTNLHIPAGTTSALESGGAPITGITTDIDGDTRPGPAGSLNGGAAATDIGADEFDGIIVDAVAPGMTFAPLANACTTGDRTFTVVITDATGVNNTTQKPRVYYKKSTGSTWFSQAGTLSSGNVQTGTWSFTIVAADMGGLANGDVIQYFTIAQDVVATPNVGSYPGPGLVAANTSTITTYPTTIPTYTVVPTLTGTINVGTGQTYTTLTNAVNAYNIGCQTGAIVFNLTDATYPSETFPIQINGTSFASATNTLTIKPATGVSPVVSGSATSAIIVLNGADYVTINGSNTSVANSICPSVTASRNLTITNTNTSATSAVIWLQNTGTGDSATHNTIRNCNINGSGITQTLAGIGCGSNSISSSSTGSNNNSNTYENNNIGNVIMGIYSSGNSAANKNNNTVINKNVMAAVSPYNVGRYGIYTNYENNITISGNKVANIYSTATNDITAINLGFSYNTVTNSITTGSDVTNATVTYNQIDSIVHNALYSSVGISMIGTTAASTNTIANNMIGRVLSNGTGSDMSAGIYIGGSTGSVNNVYDNSVYINGTLTGASQPGFALVITGSNPVTNLRNNILVNTSSNGSGYAYAIGLSYAAYTNLTSNNNDLYSTGSVGEVGSLSGSTGAQSTLAVWQTTTGKDANSKNILPDFVAANDLHLKLSAANVPLDSTGAVIAGITTDIDCQTRNTSFPDIGADEVTIPVCSFVFGGIATTPVSAICVSGVTTVTATGATPGIGMSYKWQSSTDSVTFTNISGATTTSYAIPSAITATTYYRMVATCANSGFSDSTTKKVIVTSNPPAITGSTVICIGQTGTVLDAAAGGSWSSSNPAIATIGSGSGIVSGIARGTTGITYTSAAGCPVNTTLTVNASPQAFAITPAAPMVCSGSSTLLSATSSTNNNITFGTQQSVNAYTAAPSVFSVYYGGQRTQFLVLASELTAQGYINGSVLTGIGFPVASLGTTYVNNLNFQVRIAPTTNSVLSTFLTTGLVSAFSPATYTAAVGNNVITFNSPYTWNGTSNLVFDVTSSNAITGGQNDAVIQYYTATSFNSMVCYRVDGTSATTVASGTTLSTGPNGNRPDFTLYGANPTQMTWSPASSLYTDAGLTTAYTTGTSSNNVYVAPTNTTSSPIINSYVATATGGGCSTSATASLTINPQPAVITGGNTVCTGATITLGDATASGTWSSGSTNATIGATTGIVTGVTAGTANISYTLATGCARVITVTVNQAPAAITGSFGVCTGQTSSLTNGTPSGIWSSSSAANATVSASGVVTGVATGNATISYTTLNGCFATQQVTVNATPAAIAGAGTLCTGTTITLTDATGSGAWSSSSGNAVIGTAGDVTGITAGTATVSYTVGSCAATKIITVHTTPAAIVPASATVCEGATVTFADATTGGTWSSSNANATVSSYGVVSGITAGNASITYTAVNGCTVTQGLTINPAPAAISGASVVCQASSTTLTNTVSGGTWSSSASATASVTSGGVVTGGTAGTATITYTLPAGCMATKTITVRSQPNVYSVSGGGGNCSGAPGAHIYLSGSQYGFAYTVNGGTSVTGTGATLDLGQFPVDGTYTVLATNPVSGCTKAMTGSATVYTNPLPAVYSLTGNGSYCAGGAGINIGMELTDPGINYKLYKDTTLVSTINGNGMEMSFGNITAAGTYTAVAVDVVTGCTQAQSGSATVGIYPLPVAYSVTGGGTVCAGFGAVVNLNSSEVGVDYTIYNATTAATGITVSGTGGAITFGAQTVAGTYTVQAVNSGTGCTSNMLASATVVINPAPAIHNVAGGGSYCAGTGGMHITLDGSETGINYQLYNGAAPAGVPVAGTGAAIDFGAITADGTYSVRATNGTTDCHSDMNNTTTITTLALPVAYNVSSGGSYCAGGTGIDITLDNSEVGVRYYLYNGSTLVTDIDGSATGIDFGFQTDAGTYTITGINQTTGCTNNMSNNATVVINPLPVAYNVTGGGHYCSGTGGIAVNLNNSEYGVTYTLYNGAAMVATVNGTGAGISFGNQIADGTYTVLATSAAGCTQDMIDFATVVTDALPAVYNVSGGGDYCSGSTGVHINLSGSETGVNYQLYNGGTAVGGPMAGTGAGLDWGVLYAPGTYSVMATNATLPTGCMQAMNNSATITQHALPVVQNVIGGSSYCAGGTGVHIGLSNAEAGITYTLYNGATVMATVTAATTGAIDFGLMTTPGAYNVVATSSFGCVSYMAGTASVSIDPLPEVYYVTGGGNYCIGGAGVHVGTSGSNTGINYTLYNGATAVGTLAGNGLLLDFGPQTAAGTYSIVATNTGTGCVSNMSGTTDVIINTLPVAYSVSGTGSYCAGGTGIAVTVDMTDPGTTYQLNNGTANIGSAIAGTGAAITFPAQTAGNYIVIAENISTHCTNNMTGAATITENPLPVVQTVTGGGSYCAGGTGVHIGIDTSQADVNYTLSGGTAPVVMAGTGSAIDFGSFTTAGTYTVTATYSITGCTKLMGTTTISINAQPIIFTVVGSGSYCAGGTGLHVMLTGSESAFTYQLYLGGTATGTAVMGTGAPLDFGLQTAVGTYSVLANPGGSCATAMTGAATINTVALPTVYTVTGGGSYCAGGTGVHISLSGSQTGVTYTVGSMSVAGTGSAIDLGLFTTAGTYTVLATNASGCTQTMTGAATVAITPLVTPAVSVAAAGGTTVCTGSVATLTATPVNGGTAPAYQWRVNGTNVGISSSSYAYAPANGDIVTVVLTSNAACAVPDSAVASPLTLTVVNNATPSVAITASNTEVCMGTAVTFTATGVNGGATPAYTWVVNGSVASTAGAAHTYVPANGDVVYCVMTSSLACVTTPTAYSTGIVMTVDAPNVPVVTVTALNGTRIVAGQTDTLIATVTNAGTHPTYQWKVNGVVVSGVTTPYYITDTLHNNDSVTCTVTGTGACGLSSFNTIYITLIPTNVPDAGNNNSDIRLMPNPNKGRFSVRGTIATVINGTVSVDVTDMLGQTVYSGTARVKNGNINEQIELSNTLANGMYMLNIRTSSEHKVFHFVLEQ